MIEEYAKRASLSARDILAKHGSLSRLHLFWWMLFLRASTAVFAPIFLRYLRQSAIVLATLEVET